MNREGFLAKVTYQVVVNIATAVLLFLIAAAFKSEVQALFDVIFSRTPPKIEAYPIQCLAEPHSGDPDDGSLTVDFYIINATGNAYTDADLRDRLVAANPDSSRSLEPRIALRYKAPAQASYLAAESAAFNKGKGDITVSIDSEARRIAIDIQRIESRTILKAVFRMTDLSFVSPTLNRAMSGATQLDADTFLDRCYSF